MERITRKHLERLCETVARETGKTGDRFGIDGAYGGFAFERNDSNVFRNGHQPARFVYELMHAYLAGWRDCVRDSQEYANRDESMASITGVGSYDSGEFYK